MPGKPVVERHNKYAFSLTDEQIKAGEHRAKVGPDWERTGRLQHEFLIAQGMRPGSRLLDVGCGAGRAGVLIARYLDPGRYFGIDVNPSLIRAALEHEFPLAGLADRVPAGNLRVTERFECDFGEPFDLAIANSVFTHLPLNHIRLCLHQLSFAMRPGGRFFATFFEVPASAPYSDTHDQRYRTTWPERDAYHYRAADLRWAAQSVADWRTRHLGDWGHPRGQMMMQFELRSAAGPRPEWELAARTIGREAKRRAGRLRDLRDLRPGR